MDLKFKYEKLKSERNLLQNQKKERLTFLDQIKSKHENYTKARWVLSKVAEQTQLRFKEKVESLVTMAIQSVFDRPFQFILIFEQKRNKFECRPVVMEGDIEYVPKDDMGGGIIDIISFALRVVLWSLQKPKTRNILILDEPMKYVGKGDLLDRAGNMIREISHRLGLQLLLVTHEPELSSIGDISYNVEYKKDRSIISLIKGETLKPEPKQKLKRRISR